jgi:hypothetical protein
MALEFVTLRVQDVVAQEFVCRAVMLVGAGLDRRVHGVPGRVAVLGGETGQVGGRPGESHGAAREHAERERLAAVERQVDDTFVFDYLAEGGRLGIQYRSGGRDLHRPGDGARF